jgi:hypothetical protein
MHTMNTDTWIDFLIGTMGASDKCRNLTARRMVATLRHLNWREANQYTFEYGGFYEVFYSQLADIDRDTKPEWVKS